MSLLGVFKAGEGVGALKQDIVSVPKAVAYLCAEAFMNCAHHTALCRGVERQLLRLQQFRFQQVVSLPDDCTGRRDRLNFCPQVGCQPVFPALIQDRADTAGKTSNREWDRRGCQHQTAAVWPGPDALGPEVSAGEGAAAVRLYIANPMGEIQLFSVKGQCSTERMSHTDYPMGTLHPREELKWSHNVRTEGSKRAVGQRAMQRKPILDRKSVV